MFSQNLKILKSKVKTVSFNIPAFRSKSGFMTCPSAQSCAQGCYARQGWFVTGHVQRKYEKNLQYTKETDFVERTVRAIRIKKPKRVRIHDSGDFYSPGYLNKWIEIANNYPEIVFYAYTKRIYMMKKTELPKNMVMIFSFGGEEDELIDKDKDRHCVVFPNTSTLEALGYADASKDDGVALAEHKKIGIVYHGNKSWGSTEWNRVLH